MQAKVRWEAIDGAELYERYADGSLSDLVPEVTAVYLWRRVIRRLPGCTASSSACMDWLRSTAAIPVAELGPVALSHCATLKGLSIGGGGLTQTKEDAEAVHFVHNAKFRDYVVGFAESLSIFTPPLYVGQTDSLRRRVREHLAGASGLREYLQDTLGLSWQDTELFYVKTSASSIQSEKLRSLQEFLELLAQRALAPFATERPG